MGQNGSRAFRDNQTFVCSTRVSALSVGRQTALFCEQTRKKRLFELNETASHIWRDLAAGRTVQQAVLSLEALGTAQHVAQQYVAQQLEEWLRLGHLAPSDVLAQTQGSPSASMWLALDEMNVELNMFGDADTSAISQAFATIAVGAPTRTSVRVSVIGAGDEDFLLRDDALLGMAHRRHTAPRLKTLLTEQYLRTAADGFCTHGALATLAGRNVFLAGAPGAGKTTLVLALAASGFEYGGDDTVRFNQCGMAKGLPFTASAKGPSWDVLVPFYPDILSIPVHERLDGKHTRYIAPARFNDGAFRPMVACLLLLREKDAQPRLEPISPLEALSAILRNAYIEHPPPVVDAPIRALAANLSTAICARLVYDDLIDAVQLVRSAVAPGRRG